jgi:hypothetical protein
MLIFLLAGELVVDIFEGDSLWELVTTAAALLLALYSVPSGLKSWIEVGKAWRLLSVDKTKHQRYRSLLRAAPRSIWLEALVFLNVVTVLPWVLFLNSGQHFHFGLHISACLAACCAFANGRRRRRFAAINPGRLKAAKRAF